MGASLSDAHISTLLDQNRDGPASSSFCSIVQSSFSVIIYLINVASSFDDGPNDVYLSITAIPDSIVQPCPA